MNLSRACAIGISYPSRAEALRADLRRRAYPHSKARPIILCHLCYCWHVIPTHGYARLMPKAMHDALASQGYRI